MRGSGVDEQADVRGPRGGVGFTVKSRLARQRLLPLCTLMDWRECTSHRGTLNVEGPAQMLWMTSKRLSILTLMLKRHVIHRLVGDFAM
jgi:hypothetical protein